MSSVYSGHDAQMSLSSLIVHRCSVLSIRLMLRSLACWRGKKHRAVLSTEIQHSALHAETEKETHTLMLRSMMLFLFFCILKVVQAGWFQSWMILVRCFWPCFSLSGVFCLQGSTIALECQTQVIWSCPTQGTFIAGDCTLYQLEPHKAVEVSKIGNLYQH